MVVHRDGVADARRLPFGDGTLSAIATEPPYDERAGPALADAYAEMCRVLKPGGRLALLCAEWQAAFLRASAGSLGLSPYLDSAINRKGTNCVAMAWRKGEA